MENKAGEKAIKRTNCLQGSIEITNRCMACEYNLGLF
jgi:hypothetical protein